MAGGVEAVLAAVDDSGAQRGEAVEHGLHARLVAGDDLGGVQDEVVAVELQRVVLLARRQRQRRPWLRLRAAKISPRPSAKSQQRLPQNKGR